MRIYSKFKDYYDSLLHMFAEEIPPVYQRKQEEINEDYYSRNELHVRGVLGSGFGDLYNREGKAAYEFSGSYIIGFCGKLYLVYKFRRESSYKGHGSESYAKNYEFVYKPQRMHDIQQLYAENKCHITRYGRYVEIDDLINGRDKIDVKVWKEQFENVAKCNNLLNLFKKYKTPIFVIGNIKSNNRKLIINANLSEYGFQKAVDPYTAIQELDMYLSNDLAQETNLPVEITDDKLKAQQHGHDGKYSFKKPPGKKRKRR